MSLKITNTDAKAILKKTLINQMKYEIWVLESFENLIENSFIGKFILLDMLKKYYY